MTADTTCNKINDFTAHRVEAGHFYLLEEAGRSCHRVVAEDAFRRGQAALRAWDQAVPAGF